MLNSRRRTDFVVGLFVLAAMAATVFVALRAANITELSDDAGYAVTIQFENVGSLGARAPVKSGGVKVGQVRGISFNSAEFVAEVDVVIFAGHSFPVDSIFSIVSGNLLGGQYVAIEAGGEDDILKGGEVLEGNSALVLEHLLGKLLFEKAGE